MAHKATQLIEKSEAEKFDKQKFVTKLMEIYNGFDEEENAKSLTETEREIVATVFYKMYEVQGTKVNISFVRPTKK